MKKALLAVVLMTASIGTFANTNNTSKPNNTKTSKNNEPKGIYCKVTIDGVKLECVLCDCEALLKKALDLKKNDAKPATSIPVNTQESGEGQIGYL